MSVTFGSTSCPVSPSESEVITEWTDESSVAIKSYRGGDGVTVTAAPTKVVERRVTVSGIGHGGLTGVASSASLTSLSLVSVTIDESADDVPKYKAEYTTFTGLTV